MIAQVFRRQLFPNASRPRPTPSRPRRRTLLPRSAALSTRSISRARSKPLWPWSRAVDGYLTASAPWKQPESVTDEQHQAVPRHRALHCRRGHPHHYRAGLSGPSRRGRQSLAAARTRRHRASADLKNLAWGGLKPGTKLGEIGPVFPRAEKDAITRMQEIEQRTTPTTAELPLPRARTPAEPPKHGCRAHAS